MLTEQFLALANLSTEALLILTTGGTVLAANATLLDQLGSRPEAIQGRLLTELITEAPETVAAYLRECWLSREKVPGSLTLRREGGGVLVCRCEGACLRSPSEEGLLVLKLVPGQPTIAQVLALNQRVEDLSREVSHRRQAEEELRAEREHLRVTLASIGDAVLVTDGLGIVTFFNPSAETLTGWSRDEALGKPLEQVFAILDERSRLPADNPVARALREGIVAGLTDQTLLLLRGGGERPIDDCAAPIRGEDGSVVGAVLVFRDATERRQTDNHLRAQASRLAEIDQQKNAWISMLAHELRNPLSPVLTSLHTLRLPAADPPAREQAGITLERQIQHFTRLIDDLLDVSRISMGKIQLRRERLDLARLIRAVAQDRRATFERAGLSLDVQVPETPLWVQGDETRLAQALSHLLENAAKFTEQGGKVNVRADCLAAEERAAIHIEDTGLGIDPDLLPHLFEPFSQADRSLERTRGGLGLGLALVKGLIELHGGQVQAASAGPGRGAEFTLWLPSEREPPALGGSLAPEAATPGPALRQLRILVVEDHRDSADSLQLLLTLMGHEVKVAYTGPDGLRQALEWLPDVVISDIGLPGLDGYAVAAQLRGNPATTRTRLIALTGYGRKEDQCRALESGFNYHLTKPANPAELQLLLTSTP